MTTENLALFQAMGAKMSYLHQRQGVIAQNVANSDTPGYRPKDLVEVDFGRVLKKVITDSKNRPVVNMAATDDMHLPPPGDIPDPRSKKQKQTYEVAPAGNAVVLEEQMIKAGRNSMDYSLISNIYQKNVGMLRTAIGRGQ